MWLALIGIPVALRLWFLWARPLWFDEIFTLFAARGSFPRLLEILVNDSGPPFFYLLARPFVLLSELLQDDHLSRIPSFLAVLLLTASLPALPRGRARVTGALLLGASPLVNLYASEARAYALLALLLFVLFLLALRVEPSPAASTAGALLTALALYTHYLALLAVGALIVIALARRRWKSAAALGAGTLLFLPWVPVLLGQPEGALSWMDETPGRAITGLLSSLGGVGRIPDPFGSPLPAAWPVAGIALGSILLVRLLWRARNDGATRDAVAFVVLVLAAALCVSIWKPLAFAGRTEMTVLPVWLWAVARAAATGRWERLAAYGAAALGLSATLLLAVWTRPDTLRVVSAVGVEKIARPGDLLFAFPPPYLLARLVRERGLLAAELRGVPLEIETHPGWWRPESVAHADLTSLAQAMDRAKPGTRIFLLVPPAYRLVPLENLLASRGGAQMVSARANGVLMLWMPRDPPSGPR